MSEIPYQVVTVCPEGKRCGHALIESAETPITLHGGDGVLRASVQVHRESRRAFPVAGDGGSSANASVVNAFSLSGALWRIFRRRPVGALLLFLRRGNFDESIIAAIAGHRDLLEIMRRPQLRVLMQEHPQVVFRPFRGYLATNFRKKERRQALREHYRYLTDAVRQSFFWQIVRGKHTLWRKRIDQDDFSVTISFPPSEQHSEGDLVLAFQVNGMPLYRLSFSIAPGHLVGSAAEQVALIARVQGVRAGFAAIRRATKACSEIAPPHILMAAVQGIAGALEIKCMAGVRNSQQVNEKWQSGPETRFDYDAFWKTIPGVEGQRFYLMPLPLVERPLEQIGIAHRRRTRLKRQFKRDIREAIRSNFTESFMLAADPGFPPPANVSSTPRSHRDKRQNVLQAY